MGVADIRDAFVDAAAGRLTCGDVRHSYLQDGNNSQVLTVSGQWADGAAFAITSDPIDPKASLQLAARLLAEKLIAGRATP